MLPRGGRQLLRSSGGWRYAVAAGVCLAIHFAAWIGSLAYTSVAASTTLVTATPIWVSLLGWVLFRETLSRQAIAGISVAVAGSVLVAIDGSSAAGSAPLLGNALATIGSWAVAGYLLLSRTAQRRHLPLSSFSAIAFGIGASILLPLPGLFGISYLGYDPTLYLYLLAVALVPQLIGHTSLNWSLRWVAPVWVTLVGLLEPIGASLLAWLVLAEVPSLAVLVGGIVLLSGIAIAVRGGDRTKSPTST